MLGKYRGIIDCTEEELQDILSQYKESKLPCHIDEKGWVYGSLIDGKTPYIVSEVREAIPYGGIVLDYWYPVKKNTVGQYIERKDKNDIEIYEYDIVCVCYKDKKDSVTGIVFYDTSKSRFALIYYSFEFDDIDKCYFVKECFEYFDNSNIDNFEIIGNVCVKPKLSEVEE